MNKVLCRCDARTPRRATRSPVPVRIVFFHSRPDGCSCRLGAPIGFAPPWALPVLHALRDPLRVSRVPAFISRQCFSGRAVVRPDPCEQPVSRHQFEPPAAHPPVELQAHLFASMPAPLPYPLQLELHGSGERNQALTTRRPDQSYCPARASVVPDHRVVAQRQSRTFDAWLNTLKGRPRAVCMSCSPFSARSSRLPRVTILRVTGVSGFVLLCGAACTEQARLSELPTEDSSLHRV